MLLFALVTAETLFRGDELLAELGAEHLREQGAHLLLERLQHVGDLDGHAGKPRFVPSSKPDVLRPYPLTHVANPPGVIQTHRSRDQRAGIVQCFSAPFRHVP